MHIKKLEGAHDFAVWEKQCYNILLQKKQATSIKVKGVIKPTDMDQDDGEVDEFEHSAIELSIFDTFLFNIEGLDSAYAIWTRLQELYGQMSVASKVYWLKKLTDLSN